MVYRQYLLGVLMVILAFNYVDRLALGLVLQDVKHDLALSDTQLGLLTGIAFALFYSLMGIPLARWADRGNRRLIITVTTGLWSVAVILCGFAANFVQLMLVRVGVAIGEAGCVPPAHSLIADYFDRAERPRAVARYMLGGALSVVVGYFVAGWVSEFFGWRVMFVVLGLPGVVLAVLAWTTVRETRGPQSVGGSETKNPPNSIAASQQRRAAAPHVPTLNPQTTAIPQAADVAMPKTAASQTADTGLPKHIQPSLREVMSTLWRLRTFRHLLLGFSVIYFFAYGISQWQPAFFIRSFGFGTGELGTWFAVIYGLGSLAGTHLGGEWAARYAANNERLQLEATAIAYAAAGVVSVATYFAPNRFGALAAVGCATVGVAIANGPLFATVQTLVPERMRAMAIATIYLFANLIGMGLGPLAAGLLSDLLRPVQGDESLRYALVTLCPGYGWAAWHIWRASRTVSQDLAATGDSVEGVSVAGSAVRPGG